MTDNLFYEIREGVIINIDHVIFMNIEVGEYNQSPHVQLTVGRVRLNADEIAPLAARLKEYRKSPLMVVTTEPMRFAAGSNIDPQVVAKTIGLSLEESMNR